MCFGAKAPKTPDATPRPKTNETASTAQAARAASSEQRGVFANIFTSTLGDTGYGGNINKK